MGENDGKSVAISRAYIILFVRMRIHVIGEKLKFQVEI